MTVDERTRLRIRQWFLQQMKDEEMADAIMESMPPVDWSELATKHDLALTTRELRTEIGELRIELKTEAVELKTELRGGMGELRSEIGQVRAEMADFRGDVRGGIATLRNDLASVQRTIILVLVGFALTVWISLLVV